MKKDKLIELLNSIDGNPDIVIWNGYVEDYMNIDSTLIPLTLVKETQELIFEGLKATYAQTTKSFDISDEKLVELNGEADILHKKRKWDIPNEFVTDAEFKMWYGNKKKTIYVLNPKLRDKISLGISKSFDLKY